MIERMSITVRHTEPDDFRAVQKIFMQPRAVWGTMQLPYPSAESWRKKLENPPSGFYSLVACAGDEVVGSAGLHTAAQPRRRHAGSVGMAVRDDWQGKGAGSALIEALIHLADNWFGLTRLELTVYTDNAPAIRIYEKFGFVCEGTPRQYAFRDGYLSTLTGWRGFDPNRRLGPATEYRVPLVDLEPYARSRTPTVAPCLSACPRFSPSW